MCLVHRSYDDVPSNKGGVRIAGEGAEHTAEQESEREQAPIAKPSPSALSLWRRRPELKLEQVGPPLEASKVKRRFDFIGEK